MTIEDFHTLLKTTGFPVAYLYFNEPINPPFIVYLANSSPNFTADNQVYKKINDLRIELYTTKKELAIEELLEDIFDENDIPYTSDELYIESEQLYEKIYDVRLI